MAVLNYEVLILSGKGKTDMTDYISYSTEKMERIKKEIQQLIQIVYELEDDFPGRHFTLDGHLVGSIYES